ncbi:MAG: alpha/beta hydrolase fold domain-containing protein [Kiritimatiellae bacterium]|nr:alpha/beta hydrolase fold domain-containing protein [Kiritimatiellia bacterium]
MKRRPAMMATWLTAMAALSPAQRPAALPSAEVEVLRDIPYVTNGHPRQRVDLYLPRRAPRPLPLIIWIHGGAWLGGSKDAARPARGYPERGYAVASIGYRLSSDAIFPAQIEDCKAAVRWLRAHADQYGLDPERFGVWGSSAGGHLAALVGTAADVREFDVGLFTNVSSRVQAVCDFFGPADFRRIPLYLASNLPSAFGRADAPESNLLGGPVPANLERAIAASPAVYATPDDPPFLIVHGDRDPVVPYDQSEALFEALKQAGVHVHFHTVVGGGHGQGFGGPEFDRIIHRFFDRWLKGDLSVGAPTGAVRTAAPALDIGRQGAEPPARDTAMPRWPVIHDRSDADRDGRVTRTEFQGPAALFRRLDRNRDDVLTAEDFPPPTARPAAPSEAVAPEAPRSAP